MVEVRTRLVAAGVGLMFLAVLLGCSQLAAPIATPTISPDMAQGKASDFPEPASTSSLLRSMPHLDGVQQRGIWVMGTGRLALQPDLAIMTAGVEIQAATVAEAREGASKAMKAVMQSISDSGVQERDIQTSFFNIQPVYEWHKEGGGKQVLVGYKVTNTARFKFRRLETIGTAIDDAALAGGDLVRIQGISFTVENPESFQSQAREMAVKDALAKAQQMAALTGVTLGNLLYIAEVNSGGAPHTAFREGAMTSAMEGTTPISVGQQEILVTVQAVFGIK